MKELSKLTYYYYFMKGISKLSFYYYLYEGDIQAVLKLLLVRMEYLSCLSLLFV